MGVQSRPVLILWLLKWECKQLLYFISDLSFVTLLATLDSEIYIPVVVIESEDLKNIILVV